MTDVEGLLRTIRRLEQRIARLEGSPVQFGQNVRVDSSTDSVLDPMRLARETTGTAADGIGVGLPFYVQDASGNIDEGGNIDVVLTTAAHATQAAELRLGVLGTTVAALTSSGGVRLAEVTAPAAPAANTVIIYAQDNGAGKTQLMARFATGAAQQVAIEP